MIIGTAGHIDHGKTTLVRALTGVDTDRLKEEKARGISIELGYAYTPLANGAVLGFIDVPGHERLVHTMVAGACGIDFALLVVAADDGVMPQTREHLAILELLGVAQGAVALTKADRVDEQRLREVQAEIAATLAATLLKDAPVFPLTATAPEDRGVESLRRHLHETAARFPLKQDDRLFRLAVDRVFTLSGHGTVVAGTVFSGRVGIGDTVTVMPAALPVRVRSVHAQNQPVDVGLAGQRCALNLAGIETSAISRGDWLADPRVFAPTNRLDVRLKLLQSSCNSDGGNGAPRGKSRSTAGNRAANGDGNARQVTAWTTLHVHLGTSHLVAHAVPLESPALAPGGCARVQLVFDTPICATLGDRFIVRDAQALRTLGGGVVLDPLPPARKRRSAARLRWLDVLENLIAGAGIGPVLESAPHGVKLSELVRLTALPAEKIPLPADTVAIDFGPERFIVHPSQWSTLCDRAISALEDFHTKVPDDPGPDIGRLRRIALPDLPDALWRAVVTALTHERRLVRSGPWLHLPQHKAALSQPDRELANKLQPLIANGRFDPPWVRDLAARFQEPQERVREVLRKSVTQGTVYQVVHDLFYDRECVSELATIITRLVQEHGAVNAAQYRDELGLGRKRTVQILEFFDRVGYTRRVKDSHVLRRDSGWHS